MVRQYPYILQVQSGEKPVQDENGNWVGGQTTWINLCRCRDENGSGKPLKMADGTSVVYSFLIQMPNGVEALKAGTLVRVVDGSQIREQGAVLYSRKDQLHSRAWI